MGYGFCRFGQCLRLSFEKRPKTSLDYKILLPDQNLELYICGLWEHYASQHNILPPQRAREAVMASDPNKATTKIIRWRGESLERITMYFVEKTYDGYNHEIGDSPDKEFIIKLKEIIYNANK